MRSGTMPRLTLQSLNRGRQMSTIEEKGTPSSLLARSGSQYTWRSRTSTPRAPVVTVEQMAPQARK